MSEEEKRDEETRRLRAKLGRYRKEELITGLLILWLFYHDSVRRENAIRGHKDRQEPAGLLEIMEIITDQEERDV